MMLAVPLNWYGLSPNRKRPTGWQGALVSLLLSEIHYILRLVKCLIAKS